MHFIDIVKYIPGCRTSSEMYLEKSQRGVDK